MENKLMIKLVVGTEAMFFLSLIMVYVYFSFVPGFKPQQAGSLDIHKTGLFTILLFSSSFTYWRAETNFSKGRLKQVRFWLLFTIVLGCVFLFGQFSEYAKMASQHINISSSMFGTSFFTLTGFHGLHVFAGILVISIVTALVFMGDYNHSQSSIVSTVGIYWHFVDIVWLVVFLVVYVSPHVNLLHAK